MRLKGKYIIIFFSFFIINSSIGHGLLNWSYKSLLNETSKSDTLFVSRVSSLEAEWFCNKFLEQDIDSLIAHYANDNDKLSYLVVIKAYYFVSNKEYKVTIDYIIDLLKEERFKENGNLYFLLGKAFASDENYSNTYVNYKIADSIFTENKDTLGLAFLQSHYVYYYGVIDDNKSLEESYLKGLLLAELLSTDAALIHLYFSYARHIANQDIKSAYELNKQGWALACKLGSISKIRYAISYLRFLLRYGYDSEFVSVFKEVEEGAKENCYNLKYSIAYTFYAHLMTREDKIDSAIYYNNLALDKRKESNKTDFIGFSYLNLLSNYMIKHNKEYAKAYLDSAKLYLTNSTNFTQRHYLQYALKYHEYFSSNDSILEIYPKLIELDKLFYQQQQNTALSKIKAGKDLQNLLLKNQFEIQLKLNKARLWYVGIIAFLLLFITIGLAYLFVNKSRRFNILKIRSKISFASIDEYKKEIKQLKNVFENAVTGFFILDKEFKVRYVNKRAESIFQAIEKQLSSKQFTDMFSEKYHAEIEQGLENVSSRLQNFELQVKHRINESDLILNLSFSPMIINNELESILVIALDISSRVKALDLEKKQRMILQTLFNSVTESIILLDGEGNIESINETAAKRLGKSVDELIGDNYFNQLPESVKAGRVQKMKKSILEKKAVIYDENIDSYNSLVSIYPSFDTDGDVNYIAEFLQDITERRMAVEQINSLRQKVLRSQMNPHFVFNSLNAIQSYVLKNDSKVAVKYLNSFAKLIRMILDSSRFDYINLDKEIHILEYYLDLQQLRFGDKFDWSLTVDPNIDTIGTLIPAMLAQPFIENAIEHGLQHLEGSGTVKISFVRDKETIVFKVIDNGIGRAESKKLIKGEDQSAESLSTKLFKERLYTLNKYSERKITYNIIDLKDAQSNAKGTMVVINLPIIYKSNID